MATITETARAAGVSAAVVSRILNGDETLRVRDDTRRRVMEAVEALDFSPNFAAKTLRSAESGLLALVVHDFGNPVYTEIIAGAQHAAAQFGKSVLLGEGGGLAGHASRIRQLIGGGGVDGLMLQGIGSKGDIALVNAARRWMPTVMLQSARASASTLVMLQDEEAARLATSHLLDFGHTRIGCLGTGAGLRISEGRKAGWISAMRKRGHSPQNSWYETAGSSYEIGSRAVARLLDRAPELTAILCCNVNAAVGALARLYDIGKPVPEDLSLVAIHDAPIAEYTRPALTVVKTPLWELGVAAARACCTGRDAQPGEVLVSAPAPILIQRASARSLSCDERVLT